jgi:hypothetical protein
MKRHQKSPVGLTALEVSKCVNKLIRVENNAHWLKSTQLITPLLFITCLLGISSSPKASGLDFIPSTIIFAWATFYPKKVNYSTQTLLQDVSLIGGQSEKNDF